MPTNGFSMKPLEVDLLAGEQKATELGSYPSGPKTLGHTASKLLVKPMSGRRTLQSVATAIVVCTYIYIYATSALSVPFHELMRLLLKG